MLAQFDTQVHLAGLRHFAEPLAIAATVTLPQVDSLPERARVFFALAGGGYSRGYFTERLPGPSSAAQARWHAERGAIFIALELANASDAITLNAAAEAFDAAASDLLVRLAHGELHEAFPPVLDPVRVGVGHSLGACVTIVQQAHHESFDGVVALGYSPYFNRLLAAPGEPEMVVPWLSRDIAPDLPGGMLNRSALGRAEDPAGDSRGWSAYAWTSYYDDVPRDVVEQDLSHFGYVGGRRRAGASDNLPWAGVKARSRLGGSALTPGIVAPEAAAITVPVLAAMGERDIVADPRGEARCYASTNSFELFICQRMGHMHNFASTRQILWQRIETFASGCAQAAS